jgi:hypothetical protein
MGSPWDVANATLFLASDEADLLPGLRCPSMAARLSTSIEQLAGLPVYDSASNPSVASDRACRSSIFRDQL